MLSCTITKTHGGFTDVKPSTLDAFFSKFFWRCYCCRYFGLNLRRYMMPYSDAYTYYYTDAYTDVDIDAYTNAYIDDQNLYKKNL